MASISENIDTSNAGENVVIPSTNVMSPTHDIVAEAENVAVVVSNVIDSNVIDPVGAENITSTSDTIDVNAPVIVVSPCVSWADEVEKDEPANVALKNAAPDIQKNDALVQLLINFVREVNSVLDSC